MIEGHAASRMAVRGNVSPEEVAPAMGALQTRVLEESSGPRPRIAPPVAGGIPVHAPP
jgi:hypothetical protein